MASSATMTAVRRKPDQREQLAIELSPDTSSRHQVYADNLVDLIEAGLCGDFNAVRRVSNLLVEALPQDLAAGARSRLARLHVVGGNRVAAAPDVLGTSPRSPTAPKTRLVENVPWPTEPLFLEEGPASLLARFVAEAQAHEQLLAAGLAARSNLLLVGPPGTGKTAAAGHVAARLRRRFEVVRLDAIASPMLGDTARNLRQAFEGLRSPGGFLFLDEADAIAKARGDARDVGEVKRVLNAFLQELDRLQPDSVLVAATNHPELLDRAVWRRFPYQIDMGLPGPDVRRHLWRHHLGDEADDRACGALSSISEGLSGSDIREIALSSRRMAVLANEPIDLPALARATSESGAGRLSMPRPLTGAERGRYTEALSAAVSALPGNLLEPTGRRKAPRRRKATVKPAGTD